MDSKIKKLFIFFIVLVPLGVTLLIHSDEKNTIQFHARASIDYLPDTIAEIIMQIEKQWKTTKNTKIIEMQLHVDEQNNIQMLFFQLIDNNNIRFSITALPKDIAKEEAQISVTICNDGKLKNPEITTSHGISPEKYQLMLKYLTENYKNNQYFLRYHGKSYINIQPEQRKIIYLGKNNDKEYYIFGMYVINEPSDNSDIQFYISSN